jgi:hypothetical protein
MLKACPSMISAGLSADSSYYYPASSLGDSISADAMPVCDITETAHSRTRYAESGVVGLPSGSLRATIRTTALDIGQSERLGRAVCAELQAIPTGLPNLAATVELCSDPKAGEDAAAADAASPILSVTDIAIEITYGLNG